MFVGWSVVALSPLILNIYDTNCCILCSVIISFVVIIVLAAGKPLKYDPDFKGPIRGKSRFVVVTCFMHQVVNLELHYNKQTVKSKHIEIEYIYA